MTGKKAADTRDEDYMRQVWEWAAEVQLESGHAVRMAVTPIERKGVFMLRAQVVAVVDGRAIGVYCQVEKQWPDSTRATLTGALCGLLIRLEDVYRKNREGPLA